MTAQLILASASPYRAKLLSNAGVNITSVKANIDERQLESAHGGAISACELAQLLANEKAHEVSRRFPQAVVIGCDQILEFNGTILHKVATLAEAEVRLRALSGLTHQLHSAISVFRAGQLQWATIDTAALTMRPLTKDFIVNYLQRNGDALLTSVGCYQIENEGIQLFAKIDGDFFTIVGLPLLSLLKFLRDEDIIGC